MKALNILLIGIGGVYNYGCEAIVRGTEKIIHREYPDANIIYASRRVADDIMRLKGSDINIVERGQFRRYSAKNICRKLLSLVGFKYGPLVESLALLKDVDAVFSIGGDIYTLDYNSDYSMSFPKFGDAVEKQGIPYILWGASVGPFTENPKVEKSLAGHLRGLSLITARERATVDYLQELGVCNNVVSCADPAYVVAGEIKTGAIGQGNKFIIGINLSPLSIHYTDSSEEDAIHEQAKIIEGLITAFDARIVLIPHVVSDFNEGDDDLRYLSKVKRAIVSEHQGAVALLDTDLGFVGVKQELIKCDLVIAARMHCAINALAAHVPVILLAYSRKAVGMCQYVYGNDDWVLSLNMFTQQGLLEEKVSSMKNHESSIRDYLCKRIPEIQREAYYPLRRLCEVLENRNRDKKNFHKQKFF